MPTYDYACDACEHRFEKVQKFSEDAVKTCPECGEERARRLISAPSVVFKGSGWYVNDTRSLKQPKNGGTQSKSKGTEKDSTNESTDTASTETVKSEESAPKATEKTAASTDSAGSSND